MTTEKERYKWETKEYESCTESDLSPEKDRSDSPGTTLLRLLEADNTKLNVPVKKVSFLDTRNATIEKIQSSIDKSKSNITDENNVQTESEKDKKQNKSPLNSVGPNSKREGNEESSVDNETNDLSLSKNETGNTDMSTISVNVNTIDSEVTERKRMDKETSSDHESDKSSVSLFSCNIDRDKEQNKETNNSSFSENEKKDKPVLTRPITVTTDDSEGTEGKQKMYKAIMSDWESDASSVNMFTSVLDSSKEQDTSVLKSDINTDTSKESKTKERENNQDFIVWDSDDSSTNSSLLIIQRKRVTQKREKKSTSRSNVATDIVKQKNTKKRKFGESSLDYMSDRSSESSSASLGQSKKKYLKSSIDNHDNESRKTKRLRHGSVIGSERSDKEDEELDTIAENNKKKLRSIDGSQKRQKESTSRSNVATDIVKQKNTKKRKFRESSLDYMSDGSSERSSASLDQSKKKHLKFSIDNQDNESSKAKDSSNSSVIENERSDKENEELNTTTEYNEENLGNVENVSENYKLQVISLIKSLENRFKTMVLRVDRIANKYLKLNINTIEDGKDIIFMLFCITSKMQQELREQNMEIENFFVQPNANSKSIPTTDHLQLQKKVSTTSEKDFTEAVSSSRLVDLRNSVEQEKNGSIVNKVISRKHKRNELDKAYPSRMSLHNIAFKKLSKDLLKHFKDDKLLMDCRVALKRLQ